MTYCGKRRESAWGMGRFRAAPPPTVPLVRRLSGPIAGRRGAGGWTVDAMAALIPSWRRSSNRSRKTRPPTTAKSSTISASGGQGRGVVWVATLQRGGGARRWLTRWLTFLTTTTLPSQRAQPSLLWSEPCLESLMGSGLARIPRAGCGNRGGAAPGLSPRRPVHRAWRGRKWRERPRYFCRWCGTGEG